jgi:leucine dehydrogenase
MSAVFDHIEFDHHEQVVFAHDDKTGLRAIIAIHNRFLGPAAGGVRMVNYTSMDDARANVLRLSQGMTYKNALAGLPLGGGKAVLIGDPKIEKSLN